MSRKKDMILVAAGLLTGLALAGPASAAVEYLTATRSDCPIYVDGQQVELEAYMINDQNYVKLRDIGQAVGFNVYWDGSAAQVESDKPYTGLPPVKEETPAPDAQDHSSQANPDIFTGELTSEVYDAIRDAVAHSEEIMAGTYTPMRVASVGERRDLMERVTCKLGNYPTYDVVSPAVGQLAVKVKIPAPYDAPAKHTQPFLDGLAGLGDREKVREIVMYVGEHITYSVVNASPAKTLVSDVETPGSCMAYAHATLFLCQRAGIPCILVSSETHQWNMAYVDGKWWDLDAGASDVSGRASAVFFDPAERIGRDHTDSAPEVTRFAQELLVPGSTK